MSSKKILLAPSSFAATDASPKDRIVSAGYEVIENPYKRKLTKNELLDLLTADVVGTIAGLEAYDREVMDRTNIKVVSRVGSGLSNIDLGSANDLGVEVCYTPYGPTAAVAELTVGSLLCLLRHISWMDGDLHQRQWNKKIGCQLEGRTVLIIGFGRIGRRVAELLVPFGVNIIVVDPFLDGTEGVPCKVCALREALPLADVITVHSSGEDCVLGENEFFLMKDGVFLLNAARGGIIAEKALLEALDKGRVAGAWIDAFQNEPYTGPLCDFKQVILTPHIGSYTHECRSSMENEAVDNLLRALEKLSI